MSLIGAPPGLRTSIGLVTLGSDETLLREIDTRVLEWSKKSGLALSNGEIDDYRLHKIQISALQEWRRQIISDKLFKNIHARESAIKLIEAQTQLDESFSIPRTEDGEIVTTHMKISIHQLLRLHRLMQERLVEGAFLPASVSEQYISEIKKGLRAASKRRDEASGRLHLYINISAAIFGNTGEPFHVYCSIWHRQNGFVTKEFFISLTSLCWPTDSSLLGKLSTIFPDVQKDNILREGYLVFKVYRYGGLVPEEAPSTPKGQATFNAPNPEVPKYRRPYGCGVIALKTLDLVKYEIGTELSDQPLLKIYRPRKEIEKNFDSIHTMIIDGPEYDLEEVPMSKGISVSYALVSGNLKYHQDTHFMSSTAKADLRERFSDSPITDHLYHHENNASVDPKELKEEIHVTIANAEFSQGVKSAEKNVEISVWCVSEMGEVIQHCFLRGNGKQSSYEDRYCSTVYYHNNTPNYHESFTLNLNAFHNIDVLKCHLLFLASHCSTGQGGSTVENVRYSMMGQVKEKKPKTIFAFAFFPLMDSSRGGVIASNGLHVLNCYDPLDEVNFSVLQQTGKRNIMSNEHAGIPYLLRSSTSSSSTSPSSPSPSRSRSSMATTIIPRTLTRNTIENIAIEMYVTSLKYTHIREIHDIIHWTDIPEATLENSIEACLLLSDDKIYSCVREIIHSSIMILSINPNMMSTFKLFTKALAAFKKRFVPPSSPASAGGGGGGVGVGVPGERKLTISFEPIDESFYSELWTTCVEPAFQLAHPTIHLSLLTQLNTILQTIENTPPGNLPLDISNFYRNVMLTIPTILHISIQQYLKGTDTEETFYSLQVVMFSIISILSTLGNKYQTSSGSGSGGGGSGGGGSGENNIFQALRLNFFEIFVIIEGYYEIEAMSTVAIKYIECLHHHPNNFIRAIKKDKLDFINRLICSKIFSSSEEARVITLEWILLVIVHHFKDPLATGDDKASSLVVLQVLLERFEVLHPEDCDVLCPLFEPLLQVIIKLLAGVKSRRTSLESAEAIKSRVSMKKVSRRASSCVGNTTTISTTGLMVSLENAACCLTSLIELLGKERMIGLFMDPENGKELHLSLLVTLTILVKRIIIPQPWLLLNLLLVNAIGDITSWSSEVLVANAQSYLSPEEVSQRWSLGFGLTKDVDINIDPLVSTHTTTGDSGDIHHHTSTSTATSTLQQFQPQTQKETSVTNLILWSALMNLSLLIILDPGLTLESPEMNPAKRSYLQKHYHDYRIPISKSLLRAWQAIPHRNPSAHQHALKFCTIYTVPALALACSPCEELSHDGCQLLIDLFEVDYLTHSKFLLTSPLLYDCVSLTVLHNTSIAIDPRYIPSQNSLEIFINHQLKLLFLNNSILNNDTGHRFVSEMPILLNLLQDLSICPNTSEYEEERSYAYGKLMEFFLSVRRHDSFIKFAHNLAKEMTSFENYTEAAKAILLHAELLSWSDTILNAVDIGEDGMLEANELSWHRKKTLINQAIRHYEQGKAWEYCIELLEELITYSKSIRPNYLEVSELLQQEAKYYHSIATEDRFYPTFFRVGYYGLGYRHGQEIMRNKEFIYKGAPLESIIDFSNRIKKKFPNCEVLPPKVTPSEEHSQAEGKQFIQISKVTSVSTTTELLSQSFLQSSSTSMTHNTATPVGSHTATPAGTVLLPNYLKAYTNNFKINLFYYQKPFRKREMKSANEFLDLWVEKKYLETAEVFPNTTRRAEVKRMVTVILNPIEMAINGLMERNLDLEEKNQQMKVIADGQAGQSFTMALSGTVDAAVNGGIKNYESFVTGTYREHNPEIAEDVDSNPAKTHLVDQLIACLKNQITLLEYGIELHSEKCLDSMRPLHIHIEKTFQNMKQELRQLLDKRS